MVHDVYYEKVGALECERIIRIALFQRNLTITIIAMFVVHTIAPLSALTKLLLLAGSIYVAITLVRMLADLDMETKWRVVTLVCVFIPVVQLVVLFIVNQRACDILRRAGLRVGTISVSQEELDAYREQQLEDG